jgi:dephospho-CoA kinase
MKKIGITGGIGSGKTTVCKIFESLDIPVYYADKEAKKIMASNLSVKKQMKDLLGEDAFFKNGKPDRNYISSKIFTDKELLAKINEIVHPAVQLDADRWFEMMKNVNISKYCLKEAALMVETGSYKSLHAMIVVTCPEDIRIHRVMKRDKLKFEDVIRKVRNQIPEEDKVKLADFVIVNDGKTSLIPQVWAIHHKLMSKY